MCALAATDADDSSGHLAYPGSTHVGELNIFDTVNLRAVTSITAHDNPIGEHAEVKPSFNSHFSGGCLGQNRHQSGNRFR